MDFANYWFASGASAPIYEIGQNLRFRSTGSRYLTRTPAAAGNRKTWTWSAWVKRGTLGVNQVMFNCDGGTTDTTYGQIVFSAADQLNFGAYNISWRTTTQVFRDPNAWYHIVVAFDTTQATAANRVRIYVNGTEVTAFATSNVPTQNTDYAINLAAQHNVGRSYGGYDNFRGYLAEINFINGLALAPTFFGKFEPAGDVWVPKPYSGSYGTTGFYLSFSNASNLGQDSSGNSNTFTATGFETTLTVQNDLFIAENPTTIWNTIARRYVYGGDGANYGFDAIGTGNASANTGWNGWTTYMPDTLLPTSGKYYVEVASFLGLTYGYYAGTELIFYLLPPDASVAAPFQTSPPQLALSRKHGTYPFGLGKNTARIYNAQANTNTDVTVTSSYPTSGDDNRYSRTVIYLDMDNGAAWIGIPHWDGSSIIYVSGANPTNPATAQLTFTPGTQYILSMSVLVGDWQGGIGQNNSASFAGRYPTVHPTGYKSLVPSNLPEVPIVKPANHFRTILDTGANIKTNAQAAFPYGLWWIKDRANSNNYQLIDSVRGVNAVLQSNTTATEGTYTAPVGNSVAWCWKTDGPASSNTAGSITSTVSANASAKFSIVTYTGNSTAGATIGHGLGVAPSMVILKSRTYSATSWCVSHSGYPTTQTLYLDSTTSVLTRDRITARSATTFTVGSHFEVNDTGDTYVAYCFAEVAGYSKFGSYTGNGSSNGPFVYCGFRPAWVMIKRTDTTTDWHIHDAARDPHNVTNRTLYPNTSGAEVAADTAVAFDFVSSGFKLRASHPTSNNSGSNYIFAAFAEYPFGGANVSPSPAR